MKNILITIACFFTLSASAQCFTSGFCSKEKVITKSIVLKYFGDNKTPAAFTSGNYFFVQFNFSGKTYFTGVTTFVGYPDKEALCKRIAPLMGVIDSRYIEIVDYTRICKTDYDEFFTETITYNYKK